MKETRYCIQANKKKNCLIQGGVWETEIRAKEELNKWNKIGRLKGYVIVKRLIDIPEPPTEEEKKFMEAFSKGINGILREVLK
jgi:hypothetical protein